MEVKIKRVTDYVPCWDNNKKDKNPIVFHLRYLSTTEMDDCIEIQPSQYDYKTKKVTSGRIVQHDKRMFLNAVVSIDNFQINDGSNTEVITTAEQLLAQPGLDLLYYELVKYVKTMNARIDYSKN